MSNPVTTKVLLFFFWQGFKYICNKFLARFSFFVRQGVFILPEEVVERLTGKRAKVSFCDEICFSLTTRKERGKKVVVFALRLYINCKIGLSFKMALLVTNMMAREWLLVFVWLYAHVRCVRILLRRLGEKRKNRKQWNQAQAEFSCLFLSALFCARFESDYVCFQSLILQKKRSWKYDQCGLLRNSSIYWYAAVRERAVVRYWIGRQRPGKQTRRNEEQYDILQMQSRPRSLCPTSRDLHSSRLEGSCNRRLQRPRNLIQIETHIFRRQKFFIYLVTIKLT